MILKDKKTILRPIRLCDAPRFVKWLNDPLVGKLSAAREKKITLKEEIKWIKSLPKKMKSARQFAICTKEGAHIGSVGLHLDLKNKNAKFGILIGDKNYWNKGYGTDATKTIIDYGFRELNLHRIYLHVFEYNPRAIKVYKRLGFKLEGIEREDTYYKGKFYNSILMGLLEKEWQKLNKKYNGQTI